MFVTPAYAQAAEGGGGGGIEAFLPLILIFVVFYFLLIRPQQKKMKDHKSMLAAVRRGDKVRPMGPLNHWGVDVASREEVDAAREDALKYTEEYGIREVHQARDQHGVYSFYLQDLDGNWWEIQSVPEAGYHDALFERGDHGAL